MEALERSTKRVQDRRIKRWKLSMLDVTSLFVVVEAEANSCLLATVLGFGQNLGRVECLHTSAFLTDGLQCCDWVPCSMVDSLAHLPYSFHCVSNGTTIFISAKPGTA